MYNDARGGAAAKRIAAVAPGESGAHGATSALARLMTLRDAEPAGRALRAMHQADWIAGRLAGKFGISDENNALKTGYDPVARAWPAWIESLGIPRSLLPEVRQPGALLGPVAPEIAREIGLDPRAEIRVGTTDGIAAFLATGAATIGDAVTSLGTTLVVKVLAEKPVFDVASGVYSHRLGDRWLAGGASNSGGAALLAHFSAERLAALTPLLRPERPTGLHYYPLPAKGERFPIRDPEKPAEIAERPADDVGFLSGASRRGGRGRGAGLSAACRAGRAKPAPGAERRRRGAQRGLDAHPRPRLGRAGEHGGGDRGRLWHGAAGAPWRAAAMTAVPVKPMLIRGLSDIADRFDHVLLDQWGVLHHGDAVPAGVREAVAALRRAGKRVLVLSNSGKRAAANAARLAGLGLAPEAYDGLLSSGEACWRLLQRRDRPPFDRIGRHCLLVTRGDDRSIVEGLDLSLAKDIRDADFILMAGLDDALADPEIWRPRWAEAVTRDLPMICANPDLTMITAAGLAAGPGRIADLYEALGGDVTYVGKPHAPIYEECLVLLGQPDPRRVLAIGDSLDHDILGGARMGMATALVTSGILASAFDPAAGEPAMLDAAGRLAREAGASPDFLLTSLTW